MERSRAEHEQSRAGHGNSGWQLDRRADGPGVTGSLSPTPFLILQYFIPRCVIALLRSDRLDPFE